MSVCTKGFVATRNKSVFFVCSLVERSLNRLIGSAFDAMKANRSRPKDQPYSRLVETELLADSQTVRFRFTHEGDTRALMMFFACDLDNKERADASISMSLGDSGQSRLYVETVLKSLRALGPVFFMPCDSVGEPWQELNLPAVTYLDAVRQRFVQPGPVSLTQWMQEARTGTLDERDVSAVLGFPEAEAFALLKESYDVVAARVRELAQLSDAVESC